MRNSLRLIRNPNSHITISARRWGTRTAYEEPLRAKGKPSLRIITRCATSYRQSAIYARSGLDLDRSTLAGWVGKALANASG